jgi:hypothetical protein
LASPWHSFFPYALRPIVQCRLDRLREREKAGYRLLSLSILPSFFRSKVKRGRERNSAFGEVLTVDSRLHFKCTIFFAAKSNFMQREKEEADDFCLFYIGKSCEDLAELLS